jgi:hypothetical protein
MAICTELELNWEEIALPEAAAADLPEDRMIVSMRSFKTFVSRFIC